MTVWKWSQTANSNNSIDTSINWREGQSPGSVNGSARAMMAAIAKWRDDLAGNIVTGGSSTAYTATSNQGFTSLTDGLTIVLRMHVANGSAPTLNVDSLGAKAIASVYGTAIGVGVLLTGSIQAFTYNATDEKWIAHNTRQSILTGEPSPWFSSTPPDGYVMMDGRTIGNASSNATNRANDDCEALFTIYWNTYANTEAAIYTSGGSASTRGSTAAEDWAANKAIALLDMAGATWGGLDNLGAGARSVIGSFVTSTNGKKVGSEGVTLTVEKLPSITPTGSVSKPSITITNGTLVVRATSLISGQNGGENITLPSGNTQISTISAELANAPTFTGTSFGGGEAHNNMPPRVLGYWKQKL